MLELKILITGANGLLGRYAIRAFHKKYNVHAIVREIPEDPIEGVTYHVHDLKEDWSVETLPNDVNVIFHLAQSELFRAFPENAIDVFNVNVTSTVKLLDYARKTGVSKFVFASTGGVYDSANGPVDEDSPINTLGLLGNYFATKLCSEILTRNYTSYFDVVLLRIFFMYGKGQKRSMLIPRLVDNVLLGKPITITGGEGVKINPVHVSDVVQVLEKTISLSGSFTFNVAGPEVLNLKQIAALIGAKMDKEPFFVYNNEVGNNCIANIEHLRKTLHIPHARLEDKIIELF